VHGAPPCPRGVIMGENTMRDWTHQKDNRNFGNGFRRTPRVPAEGLNKVGPIIGNKTARRATMKKNSHQWRENVYTEVSEQRKSEVTK